MNRFCSVVLLISLSLLLSLPPLVVAENSGDVQPPTTGVANITVNFLGAWDPAAQAAVNQAMQSWAQVIFSTVPIEIDTEWGSVWQGTPAALYSSYTHSMLLPDTTAYYPKPLANALSGSDSTGNADFIIRFNSDIAGWYFGLDGQGPGNAYDLRTVALKYAGIGLGFASAMTLCGPQAAWGCWEPDSGPRYPYIYDNFIVNGAGQLLVDETLFPEGSEALGNQLKSGDVYFDGARAVAANGGARPRLFAPADWSVVRRALLLDEDAFAPGTVNALMTHTLAPGEVIHQPGPVAIAILHDLGWPQPPHGPQFDAIPLLVLEKNSVNENAVDLWQFVSDPDTPLQQLSFLITDVTAREVGLTFDGARYISFAPHADWSGHSIVTVQATDNTAMTASASFDVYVVELTFATSLPFFSR